MTDSDDAATPDGKDSDGHNFDGREFDGRQLGEPIVDAIGPWQRRVDQWIESIGVRYFEPMTNLAQLVEEVGEVARVLSRTHGEQSTREGTQLPSLADELSDVVFVAICLANQHGIDLDEALSRNLAKKTHRDRDRHRTNPKLSGAFGDGDAFVDGDGDANATNDGEPAA